jgi:hypothetical protein
MKKVWQGRSLVVAMLANDVKRKRRSVDATFSSASLKCIRTSLVDSFDFMSRQSEMNYIKTIRMKHLK